MEHNELCRVMIVDDEYIIRQGIEYLLDWEKEGFLLVGDAMNGEEALMKIEELRPDIVLSDIVMPKINGIDLTKTIQQKYPNIKVIILSSYSDFDYVKHTFQNGAVDYILKPTLNPEELLKALRKVTSQMDKRSFQNHQSVNVGRQLSKYIVGFDVSLDIGSILSMFPERNFYMLATNKKFYKRVSDIENFFLNDLYVKANAMHPCTFQIQEDVMIALLNTNKTITEMQMDVRAILEENETIVDTAFFALSNAFEDIKQLSTIYNHEVWNLLQLRFYYKDTRLLVQQAVKKPKEQGKKFDNRLFTRTLDAMSLGEALQQLWDYIEVAIDMHVNEGEIKSLVGNSLYNLISVLEDHNMNLENIRHFKLNCINLLELAVYKEDFMIQLDHICQDFKVIVASYKLDNSQDVMNRILNYMRENYSESLTLNDLAEHFGFSYHYLSSYFANQSDGTFTEHLNRVRIEKAELLLKDKMNSISEVGLMVGYSDHSYFCKVFKKLNGMTPSEYRKR